MNNPILTKYISFSLKVIGVVMILLAMIDNIFVGIPFKSDVNWQITTISTIVDRGIIPMMGMVFFLVGYWITKSEVEEEVQPSRRKLGLKLPILLLGSVLGLFFLILIPLHVKNTLKVVENRNNQITKQEQEQVKKIQQRYDELNKTAATLSQKPDAVKELEVALKNIDQALSTGELQGRRLNDQQKQELTQRKNLFQIYQQLAKTPNLPETILNRDQLSLKERINIERGKNRGIYKQSLRLIANSFFLSIGYILIAWTGLKTIENWQFKWLGKLIARKKAENKTAKAISKARPKAKVQEQKPPKTQAKRVARPQAKQAAQKSTSKRVARPQNKGGWFNNITGKKAPIANNDSENKMNLIEPEIDIKNDNSVDISQTQYINDPQENNDKSP